MGPGQPKPAKRRNRKRKRRVVSDTSSSEEDSSSSSGSSTPNKTVTVQLEKPTAPETTDTEDNEEESSSSDESQDDLGVDGLDKSLPSSKPTHPKPPPQRDSPSPQPVMDIPPFISPNTLENEQVLKEKFRKFWMASIAEGFKDDLEEIRKEPNLGPSRLALLIDSLASGADVFSSSSIGGSVNEMEVVLDQLR